MAHAIVHRKRQVTLPKEIADALHVGEGDEVEFNVIGPGVVEIHGSDLIPADQAWFWTRTWQEGEREADEDIAAGRTHGPFTNIDDMFKSLGL